MVLTYVNLRWKHKLTYLYKIQGIVHSEGAVPHTTNIKGVHIWAELMDF